jgi:guanylate kinase
MRQTQRQLARRDGIVFIFSAPSGAGKTTLINGLRSLYPEIGLSVSFTTRTPRQGEVDGEDYRFISAAQFSAMRKRGEFAESAKVHDFLYGTPRRPLDRSVAKGQDIALDIDVQGMRQIKKSYPHAVSIFLLPPSWRELKRRLVLRGTDGSRSIQRRLANARREICEIIHYDYYVVNDDVPRAVQRLKAIVDAERAKVSRVAEWRIAPLRSTPELK